MKFRFAGLTLAAIPAVFAIATPPSVAVAAEPLPLSEYGKLPDVEMTTISPSGDRIALITTVKGKRVILALEDQTKPIRVINVGDMKVRSLRWIGEDRLMLISSQTVDLRGFTVDKEEFSQARIIPIADGQEGGLVFGGIPKYYDSIIGTYGIRKIDGEYYGFFGGIEFERQSRGTGAGYQFDHGRPHLFKVNLETMKVSKIAASARAGFGKDWLIDANGEVAYTL